MIITLSCAVLTLLAMICYRLMPRKKEVSIIILLSIITSLVYPRGDIPKSIFFAIIALTIWLIIIKLSPNTIIKASLSIYTTSILLFCACLFLPTSNYDYHYVGIGGVYFEPTRLLVFSVLPLAFVISRNVEMKTRQIIFISFLAILEFFLLTKYYDIRLSFICLLILISLVYKTKLEKRLNISWTIPIFLTLILIIGILASMTSPSGINRILIILSKGERDPNGAGFYIKTVLKALPQIKFIGESELLTSSKTIAKVFYGFSPVGLALKYGWAILGIITLAEVTLIYRLFKMSARTKNTYARYVIFSIGMYFALILIYHLLSEFVLGFPVLNLPLLGTHTSMIIDVSLLSIASLLFSKRNEITYGAQLDVDYDFIDNAHKYFIERYRSIIKKSEHNEPKNTFYENRIKELENNNKLWQNKKITAAHAMSNFPIYFNETIESTYTPENKKEVFISYSTADGITVKFLADEMKKLGLNCWYSQDNIKKSKVHSNYAGAIMEALAKADMFVVVLSETANHSDHVLSEVANAFDDKKAMVPIKIENIVLRRELKYYLAVKDIREALNPGQKMKLREVAKIISNKLN